MWQYRSNYRDQHGEEQTTIENNGQYLSLLARGVIFRGVSFDALEPAPSTSSFDLNCFTLRRGCLTECEIECAIPVTVVRSKNEEQATINVNIRLRTEYSPSEKNEILSLVLNWSYGQISSNRQGRGFFEQELLSIEKSLESDTFLKICFECAFSDYSPYGQGMFGNMLCFRNLKDEYRNVHSKDDLFKILDQYAGTVQETFVCSEFERRQPKTGYRG